tara:strand:- start:32371 stop:33111 length:741 start_codon:yes stop_codon:yes gene_type:complete
MFELYTVSVITTHFNKSFFTNFTAVMFIYAGYLMSNSAYANVFHNIGFFALSGALTNSIAIYMLFEKIPFIYGSGVIPNQFQSFKKGLKRLVMDEFFSDPEQSPVMAMSQEAIKQFSQKIDYDKIFQALVTEIQNSPLGAMLNMMGGNQALEKFQPVLKEKIQAAVRNLVDGAQEDNNSDGVKQKLSGHFNASIESMIDKRLDALTPNMVKEIIQKMIRAHLGWLVVWGGVIGGLIGLIKCLVVIV